MDKKMEWFVHDRFGMFIHWGLYAIPAQGEWYCNQVTEEEYQKYFDEFNPAEYDPASWAKAAKGAGMKYAILTSKHHDGFCLFDSKLTDYKATNTKAGRDLVREFLEAFRAEGLKVGLYYSLIDWHHPDYPHYGDNFHPMRNNEEYKNVVHNFDNYIDYMHGQVRELCSNYGKLDIMWFDFSYGEMKGEKWKATDLVAMVRSLQPDIIIDNRLEVSGEGFGSIATANPTIYAGDFVSPEQMIPPEGILDFEKKPIPWESCITMNNSWGYHRFDNDFKSPELIIRKLVECVSKGGNLLLNVGPDAKGNIPESSLTRLSDIGQWLRKNGDSIYGAGIADLPKPDFGRFTRKGNRLFLHVMEGTIGPIPVAGLDVKKVRGARLVASGAELPIVTTCFTTNYTEHVFISLGYLSHATYELPDQVNTVIELIIED